VPIGVASSLAVAGTANSVLRRSNVRHPQSANTASGATAEITRNANAL
jgi:hypothetical protein